MSTILKALRRLEQERSFEQSHSLQEHVVAGSGEAPRASSHFKALAIVASAVASAAVGGLAFALLRVGTGDVPPAVAAAPAPPIAAVGVTQEVAVFPAAIGRAPAAPATAERATAGFARPATRHAVDVVEGLGSWSDTPVREVARIDPAAMSPDRSDSSSRAVAVADVGASEWAIPDATSSVESTSVARHVGAQPPEEETPVIFARDIAVVTQGPPPLPIIDDLNPSRIEPESPLSLQVEEPLPVIHRAKLPVVEVVQTVWHPLPGRREAVLQVAGRDELLRVAEGDAVGALVLLEIQPAGVVFGHEGLQIQRRVGDRSGF